ncbi:hypothetical protein [Pseudomonas viridiflava]|uniref:hypothetical protein n=1 Tax=Pseudomonas viridiflava TaxID=33069 RepID=UPI001F11C6AE|nr:hypothetical protein [Pseudomonas viridiflava]
MPHGVQEDALRIMLEGGAVRDVLVSRQNEKWTLAIRIAGVGSRWLPARSRREALRTKASLTPVGRFAKTAVPSRDLPKLAAPRDLRRLPL